MSVKISRDTTCGAARRRVLDDAVIVPMPTLPGLGVEQIGVIRSDLGQRHVELAVRDAGARERSLPERHDEVAQTGGDHFERQSSVEVADVQREPRRHLRTRDTDRFAEKIGVHVGKDGVERGRAATLGLDGQRTGGQLQRPPSVNIIAAVLTMKDGRCPDHRVPREVELFEQVEDACLPMVLRPSRVEED